jgi:hypothetical protein
LYEAQVKTIADSSAHFVEHLKTVGKLISEKNSFKGIDVGYLNYISLLKSGIPLDLTDNKKLLRIYKGKK